MVKISLMDAENKSFEAGILSWHIANDNVGFKINLAEHTESRCYDL